MLSSGIRNTAPVSERAYLSSCSMRNVYGAKSEWEEHEKRSIRLTFLTNDFDPSSNDIDHNIFHPLILLERNVQPRRRHRLR